MSINYYREKQPKLHSPLLDGKLANQEKQIKGKRTYFNPSLENKSQDNIDETLDKTLFNKKQLQDFPGERNTINIGVINSLETLIKIAGVLVLTSGGIFSLLEFIIIARTIYLGNYDISTSLITFTAAFIATITSSIICFGFSHLIKTTKHLYLNLESQTRKIEKLLDVLSKC